MNTVLAFIIGLVLGGMFGFMAVAIIVVGTRGDGK